MSTAIQKEHVERTYGRLQMATQVSGYTFDLVCELLETLIDNGGWREIAPGYTDFGKFARTLDFSPFNLEVPERKRLAEKMKKAGASNRAIADAVGVDRKTIDRDLGTNVPLGDGATKETSEHLGTNVPPESDSMSIHYSSETDEWGTPQGLFDVLNAEFKFTLDVCASTDNAKCERFYSEADDGLTKQWSGSCWMNPPYGEQIGKWVTKAYETAKEGATVVCLVPARVDTGWWWDYCRFGEVRFLRGRLKFGNGDNSAPFPSAVVVFLRKPQVIWWEGWNAK